jgi:hypothetical protein
MTDEHLDRLVRDADPYRTDLIERLGGAEQTLLEEIMSVPKLESVPEAAPRKSFARAGVARRFAAAVAAAAVVTGVVAASTLLRDQPADTWAGPVGLPSTGASGAGGGRELDLKAAERHPRLLIEEPGWKVISVYGFADENGSIAFTNGTLKVSMDWYPAKQHRDYYKDRLGVSAPKPAKVANWPADVFTYSSSDFAAMLKPRDGTFVELRTKNKWKRADFNALLTHIVRVDADAFLAALPPEVVTPGRVREAATKILADVPLPPGFDIASLHIAGANDPYQFGATVTGMVGCGWIAEWIRADRANDKAAVDRAAAALRSSHQWRVLQDMNAEGDYPEVLWETADAVADGDLPKRYAEGLGCDE